MTNTVFTKVDYTLGALMDAIELGTIGLPDIQRPFVWKNAKVRNLFDSMYQGYPVGYLLFWQPSEGGGIRTIGADKKQKAAQLLIVDGQQRLTALYAVIKGLPVVRKTYATEHIEIAFNPVLNKFAVADAATKRDKSYISNISKIWAKETDLFDLVDEYLQGLTEIRAISAEEKKHIRTSITSLANLLSFPLTALELSSEVNEEQVSEVFVRINYEGTTLKQADFILTLMSVFWDEGRTQLETFCRNARKPADKGTSPFNYFLQPDPDQLLRVCVGLGFRRARLKYVYSILRGKDLETEQFSPERREEQFAVLKSAQDRVLNVQYWHDFFKSIMLAGYTSARIISSKNNIIFAYILYLLGRTEFKVPEHQLRQLIAKWFFMSAITGRYSSSPESKMEFDLARFRGVTDADEFVSILNSVCHATLTAEFWEITVPTDLATAAAVSPSMYGYFAALNLLDARALYSKQKVRELMDPAIQAARSSLERHHLFPKAHLKTLGISGTRETNQIANYSIIEWGENAEISDDPPAEYVPVMEDRHTKKELERMYYWHALPDGWAEMDYSDFLMKRRELMANVIRDAYLALMGALETDGEEVIVSVDQIIASGETSTTEFKSTLRINLHTGQKDSKMELSVLKTIAAFVNSSGGTLVIGVADDGNPVGIEADKFSDEDKMYLHFDNLVKDRVGPQHTIYISPQFDDYDGTRVMLVNCQPGKSPIFVKDGNVERFYVRMGASTAELTASQTQDYVKQRF